MNQDLSCNQCGSLLDKKYVYLKNEQSKEIKLICQDHRNQISVPKLKLIQYDYKQIGVFPQFRNALHKITEKLTTDLLNLNKIILNSIRKIEADIIELKELRKQAKFISKAKENNAHVTVLDIEKKITQLIEQFQKVFNIKDFKSAYDKISIDDFEKLEIDVKAMFVRYILQ